MLLRVDIHRVQEGVSMQGFAVSRNRSYSEALCLRFLSSFWRCSECFFFVFRGLVRSCWGDLRSCTEWAVTFEGTNAQGVRCPRYDVGGEHNAQNVSGSSRAHCHSCL